jgi:hypothetical protein
LFSVCVSAANERLPFSQHTFELTSDVASWPFQV